MRKKRVQILLFDQKLRILFHDEDDVNMIKEVFWCCTSFEYVANSDARHGIKLNRKHKSNFLFDRIGKQCRFITDAGFLFRIKWVLENLGYDVQVDRSKNRQIACRLKFVDGARVDVSQLIRFVHENVRGLIRVNRSPNTVVDVVRQICQAFPKSRFVVISQHRNDIQYLARKLKGSGLSVGVVLDSEPRDPKRIILTTPLGVGTGSVHAEFVDFALYLQPSRVLGNDFWKREGFERLKRARVFGIQVDDYPATELELGQTEAVFGICEIHVSGTGVKRPVEVQFIDLGKMKGRPGTETPYQQRRELLFNHTVRNRRIARLAKAVAEGNYQKLASQFPELVSRLELQPDLNVVLVAANNKQAGNLRRVLGMKRAPEFAGEASAEQMPVPFDIGARDQPEESLRIVTLAELQKNRYLDFDVLVRADGISGAVPSDGSSFVCLRRERQPLLILDFDDRYQAEAQQWTRQRKAAYLGKGWDVMGGPKVRNRDLRRKTDSRARELFVPYAPPLQRWVAPDDKIFKGNEWQYERRRQKHLNIINRKIGQFPIQLEHIADRDVLFNAFRELRMFGGTGAGVDGISPLHVTPTEFGPIAGELATVLKNETWNPTRTRSVLIEKPDSEEKRELQLSILLDRVVGKALHNTLAPLWEKIYVKNSFGFRPKRCTWDVLARVKATVEKTDRKILVNLDVRKAFDRVPIQDLIEKHAGLTWHRKPLLSPDVIRLIEKVLRGVDDSRETGIHQGGCYSPDAMNLLLHYVHDVPFQELDIIPSWYRYADNLVYLCRDAHEGELVIRQVTQLLADSRLEIKPGGELVDLAAGETAKLLGFEIALEGTRIKYSPLPGYQDRLRQSLQGAWESCDPLSMADNQLGQWISQHGPALEDGDAVLPVVDCLAQQCGFDLAGERLQSIISNSTGRWRKCVRRARQSVRGLSVVSQLS